MKSILKKVAGVALVAVLALGMFNCSFSSDYSVKETVATPEFSVESSAVINGTEVTISCATEGAKIYYTIDGTEPTASSTEYKAAIIVMPPMTLKAIAVKDGMNDSAVASASYTIKGTVAIPVFGVAPGAVNSGTSVIISCATEGARIYYTTDGTEPTAKSTEYTAAISVTEAVTLKAIAVKNGMNNSAVASASYTIKGTVATPVFSVAPGAVNSGTSVSITCATEGAKIYYTTDGTEPTAKSKEYKAAISVTEAVTLKAIAVKAGMNNSAVASASYTIKGTVAIPIFSVASGAVNSGTSVIISCATEGARIYYTTDGTEPTAKSTEYKAAISVTEAVTLKAIAVKDGMNDSAVASANYTIKGTVAIPVFSVASGAVNSGTSVIISCATEGAKIYYTTDGTEPTASSTEYKAAISVTEAVTLKAIAVKNGMNNSAVASVSYTIKGTVVTPEFSVESSAVNSGTSVSITCATEGARIYYTTDGTEPTASSKEYTAAISVTAAVTLKAIAVKDGMNNSAVVSANYTIKGTVVTPVFSVASGAVNSGTSVTITCATEGAKIYYTTDGTEPTAKSTEYKAAISVTPPMTIKAIAVKDGMNNSVVASASYTIIPEDFVEVKGTTITGNESWTPFSNVFVSGRSITIPDMYVCDHEVTQAEYEKYCKYGYSSPSSSYGDGDNYPAYYVNWYDAIVYCNLRSIDEGLTPVYKIGEETDPAKWSGIVGDSVNGYCGPSSSNSTWDALTYDKEANGYRLPTEAEWEWLARGGESYTYAGSDTADDVGWFKTNTNGTGTREVKTKQANGYGLYDMSGNESEWCYDWFGPVSSSTADTGASSGSKRVGCGGCWCIPADCCAVSYRLNSGPPYERSYFYGFRVVRNAN